MAFGVMLACRARNMGSLNRNRAWYCGVKNRTSYATPRRQTQLQMIRGFPNQRGSDSDSETEMSSQEAADAAQGQQQHRALNDLVDFPCVFTFKIIGLRQGQFAEDMCDCVAEVLEIQRENVKLTFRDKGKYRSLTINAPCNNADQIY
eukprot:CAMPEP_0185852438 /NCGR_PEP_ID=MMETSP1354-20130828/14729_1 /TAXON_ID=708628 /ORGANISM="Erythrolobus madagascarensis, Strain CCMP3276" /LENGTH=147 /DNA_ID=CAMNT_0028553677 /DNA_START=1 /DNA_END=441 /DNA_ORIENTATION=+